MDKHSRFSFSQSQNKGKRKSSQKKSTISSNKKQNLPKVTIQRISDSQEAIQLPFQLWVDPIKKFIKQKGAKWCPVFRFWKLPRVQMQSVKKQLPSLLTAEYELPPSFIDIICHQQLKQQLIINKQKYSKEIYKIQDHPLFDKLYPFQRDTLQFSLKHHGRILIADQMGVGKSIQSLACCYLYAKQFPVLIICPSSLKHVWKDEVGKWFKNKLHKDQVLIIKKSVVKQNEIKSAKFIIVSYEIAAKLTQQLNYIKIAICDQAHYLRNPETNRCQQLVPFLMRKKRIFLLTGTPLLAKPKQIFNLLKILRPDIFKNIYQFGNRYCLLKNNPWNNKLEFDSSKNLGQLHYILKKAVMIRRLKLDVLPQLPPKQRQIIYMQTQKSVIKQIQQTMGNKVSVDNIRNSQKIIDLFNFNEKSEETSSIMRCYQLTAMAKIQSIKEYVGSILENDAKIILFAHHKIVMDELQAYLKNLRVLFIRLDGSVTAETRKKKVDKFQDQYDIKIALLSITAMGTGFTLTAASTVIFAQLHWTPANLIQAQDRTHRIGQKNAVNIHYLIGEGTLDPLMLRQLQRKVDTIGQVMNAQKQTLNLQQIPKGQLGRFELSSQQYKNHKGSKITDYFIPLKSKSNGNNSQSQQVIEDSNEDIVTIQKQQNSGQKEQSQEQSMYLQFMRKKKLQFNCIKKYQPSQ